MSNHISYIEPIFFSGQGCSHVAKSAIGDLPLVAPIARALQLCFVDRTASASCADAKNRIAERCVVCAVLTPGPRMPATIPRLSSTLKVCLPRALTTRHHVQRPLATAVQVWRVCSRRSRSAFVALCCRSHTAAVVRVTFSFFDPTSCYGAQLWWIRMFSQFVQVPAQPWP